MAAQIGRSIGGGFRTANRSWAGIGLFAGGVLLAFLVLAGGVSLTKPPAGLFQPAPSASLEGETDWSDWDAQDMGLEGDDASLETPPTDLFDQLDDLEPAQGAAGAAGTVPAESAPEAPAPQGEREGGVAEDAGTPVSSAQPASQVQALDRLTQEWFGRAWPMLLLIVLVAVAVSAWLGSAQIGYLAHLITTGQSRVGEFVRSGNRAFLSMLGAVALVWLVGGIGFLLLALGGFIASNGMAAAVTMGVLGALLAVPVVWLVVRCLFWFVAIAGDRLGPLAGLRASFKATRGRWWRVVGLGLLLGLISFGVSLIVAGITQLSLLPGGTLAVVLGIVTQVVGFVVNLYIGFATLAAVIQFYQDTKSSPVAVSPSAQGSPALPVTS